MAQKQDGKGAQIETGYSSWRPHLATIPQRRSDHVTRRCHLRPGRLTMLTPALDLAPARRALQLPQVRRLYAPRVAVVLFTGGLSGRTWNLLPYFAHIYKVDMEPTMYQARLCMHISRFTESQHHTSLLYGSGKQRCMPRVMGKWNAATKPITEPDRSLHECKASVITEGD